jgi:hypothetical protein
MYFFNGHDHGLQHVRKTNWQMAAALLYIWGWRNAVAFEHRQVNPMLHHGAEVNGFSARSDESKVRI